MEGSRDTEVVRVYPFYPRCIFVHMMWFWCAVLHPWDLFLVHSKKCIWDIVSPFFRSSLFTTLLLKKIYIGRFLFAKESEEDFQFYEKRLEVKVAFSVCFAANHDRGSGHPQQQGQLCQGPVLGISALHCHSLNCVRKHLCFTFFLLYI